MSRRGLAGLATASLLGLCLLAAPAAARQEAGKPAADFTLPDLLRAPTRLGELRGKVVVLDFWASWCEPCLKELPELEKLHRELSPRGVVFVAVNLDKELKNALDLVRKLQLTLKVLHDPEGKVAEQYDPPKMPSSYVIDKSGVVRFVNEGYNGAPDLARLRKQLEDLSRGS